MGRHPGVGQGDQGINKGVKAWLIASDDAIRESTQQLSRAIESTVLPWFESVSTPQGFADSLLKSQLTGDWHQKLRRLTLKQAT